MSTKAYEEQVALSNERYRTQSLKEKPWAPDFCKEGTVGSHVYWDQGCHANMAQLHGTIGLLTISTSLYKSKDATFKDAERFWEWLIKSDDSPYRKVTKDSEIIYNKNGNMCGLRVKAIESARLITNLFVATRIPYESNHRLISWTKLVNAGLTGLEAFYMQNFVGLSGMSAVGQYDGGHYPLPDWLSFQKLKEADPCKGDKSILEDSNYLPNNIIWSTSQRYTSKKSDGDMSVKDMKVLLCGKEIPPYGGSFKKMFEQHFKKENENTTHFGATDVVIKRIVEKRKELFA